MIIDDDYLYVATSVFKDLTTTGAVIRIHLDTFAIDELFEGYISNLYIDDNKLYYLNHFDGAKLEYFDLSTRVSRTELWKEYW